MEKRNIDLHTTADQVKRNILTAMLNWQDERGMVKSTMGYFAYPEYSFLSPQGAAFSVAKVSRQLHKDGLITNGLGNISHFWKLTGKGVGLAQQYAMKGQNNG